MVAVKICGLRDPDMVRLADEAGADWIGFMFVEKSVRAVTVDAVASLMLPIRRARPVAVLADADNGLIDAVVETGIPVLQLHGGETPARVAEIKARTGIEVWKALGVSDQADLAPASDYNAADRLLIDAKAPADAAVTGGHGAAFDWNVLDGWEAPRPWLLAGGLTAATVAEAVRRTRAEALDVSSAVERTRGWKDGQLVRSFLVSAKGP
ncbi:MAG: phosphoribosylanthranilate isomerase [Pseudomonadota bacterium]